MASPKPLRQYKYESQMSLMRYLVVKQGGLAEEGFDSVAETMLKWAREDDQELGEWVVQYGQERRIFQYYGIYFVLGI